MLRPILLGLLLALAGCVQDGGNPTPTPPAPGPQAGCGKAKLGDVRQTACEDNTDKVEVCTDKGWKVIVECGGDTPNGGGNRGETKSLDWLESVQVGDITSVEADDAPDYRYLVVLEKYNEGERDTAKYLATLNKAINSVSNERDIINGKKIDDFGTVYRVNIDDLGINAQEWKLIEQNNPLPIVSNTSKGRLLRALIGTDQPWMYLSSFIEATEKANVYYTLMNVPATLAQLQAQLGVDIEDAIDDEEVVLAATTQSPISLQKPREVLVTESDDGYYWQTFDPIDVDAQNPERNPFEFPFPLADFGSQLVFETVASEVIWNLENGALGYALFNAAGVRQDVAPLNVVSDNLSPVNPEIRNAISCHRCHSSGILVVRDEMRSHILANASQFGRADVDLALTFFDQNHFDAERAATNDIFKNFARKIGLDVTQADPINALRDPYRLNWTLEQAAAFFLLTPDELTLAINQTAVGRARLGNLTTGGTVTFQQLVETFAQLVAEARLFEDPL